MEWWVIDLGDGFRPGLEATNGPIAISDIVSVPMLAIWHGMHAVHWQGPPTAGPAAAASFLLQAAMRSALDPNLSSALLQRNYFLISQNYCNLSLRLGYHYAMIEARTSERSADRYITFRFKGGAAGDDQRRRRVELLADILARFGFHVDLVGDALTARVERADEAFLCERLRILGYLTIHTRQLDLAMTDTGAHRFYRERFIHEIEAMLSNAQ
jgi:pyruvate,water dikinase